MDAAHMIVSEIVAALEMLEIVRKVSRHKPLLQAQLIQSSGSQVSIKSAISSFILQGSFRQTAVGGLRHLDEFLAKLRRVPPQNLRPF